MPSPTRFHVGFAVVALLIATPLLSADDQPSSAIVVELRPQSTLSDRPTPRAVLTHAAYRVDVYVGKAVGTVTQTFEHDSEDEWTAVYRAAVSAGSRFGALTRHERNRYIGLPASLQVARDDGKYERAREPAPQNRTVRNAELRRQLHALQPGAGPESAASSGAMRRTRLQSRSFVVDDTDPVEIVAEFETRVLVDGRTFKLRLPVITNALAGALPVRATIDVSIHHDRPLWEVRSATHEVLSEFVGDSTVVQTVEAETDAGIPFELEFALGKATDPTVASYVRGGPDGLHEVETYLTPPEKPREASARAKELLFIVDSSGSMKRHDKMAQARRAVEWCIERLTDGDRFNVVEFDNKFTVMSPELIEASDTQRVAEVRSWLESVEAGGGTYLLPALRASLVQPHDTERHREIVVITDGKLGDQEAVLELLEEELGEGRMFVVGTGPDQYQAGLMRLAEYGRGAATFASTPDGLEPAIAELFAAIAQPIGWDLEFDWAGADVEQTLPARLPDLYGGRPVRVLAWVRGDLPDTLRVQLTATDGKHYYDVKLPPRPAD